MIAPGATTDTHHPCHLCFQYATSWLGVRDRRSNRVTPPPAGPIFHMVLSNRGMRASWGYCWVDWIGLRRARARGMPFHGPMLPNGVGNMQRAPAACPIHDSWWYCLRSQYPIHNRASVSTWGVRWLGPCTIHHDQTGHSPGMHLAGSSFAANRVISPCRSRHRLWILLDAGATLPGTAPLARPCVLASHIRNRLTRDSIPLRWGLAPALRAAWYGLSAGSLGGRT